MGLDPEKVKARRQGREEFSTLASFYLETPHSEAEIEGFNRAALEYGAEHCQAVDREVKMDERQASEFDAAQVGFGVHQYSLWRDVPLDYVVWYAERCRVLLRWFDSDRVQRRLARED